jgi:hypothetical protein
LDSSIRLLHLPRIVTIIVEATMRNRPIAITIGAPTDGAKNTHVRNSVNVSGATMNGGVGESLLTVPTNIVDHPQALD